MEELNDRDQLLGKTKVYLT